MLNKINWKEDLLNHFYGQWKELRKHPNNHFCGQLNQTERKACSLRCPLLGRIHTNSFSSRCNRPLKGWNKWRLAWELPTFLSRHSPSEKLNGYLLLSLSLSLSLSPRTVFLFIYIYLFIKKFLALLRFPSLRSRAFIDGFVEASFVWSAIEITSLSVFEFFVSAVVMDGLVVDALL